MTLPRGSYGGGYYATPSFADTPIYDSLVAERGTPQIAPIRVPSAYETGSHLPALPALPSGPSAQAPQPMPRPAASHTPPHGHPAAGAPQPAPLQQAPAPYIPQQASTSRGYGYPAPQQPGAMRPVAPRPAAPRPAAPRPMPGSYEDPYGRPHPGQGY